MLDKSAFISRLKVCFPDVDSIVYVITTSVARTGMSRRVRVLCVRDGMDMHWVVAEAIMRAVGHKLRKVSL